MSSDYKVVDRLYLWWLAAPTQPGLIGELNLVKTGLRGVSLTYAPGWLRQGIALSEDLPLSDIEHLPKEKDAAAGAVDDARPDRWGERVIRHIDRPPRLSTLELLYFVGDDRFGALGFRCRVRNTCRVSAGLCRGWATSVPCTTWCGACLQASR